MRLKTLGLFGVSCMAVLGPVRMGMGADTIGFTADINDARGGAADNGGLNIGHTFTVSGAGIQVNALGVYDYLGNGLLASHTVTLLSDSGSTHTSLGSVSVLSGTVEPLLSGFRFATLSSPITLAPGNYSVIAYQLNGSGVSDEYGEATNNGFNSDANVSSTGFTPFAFTSDASPNYPTASSATSNLASASFTFVDAPEPASLGLIAAAAAMGLPPAGVAGNCATAPSR